MNIVKKILLVIFGISFLTGCSNIIHEGVDTVLHEGGGTSLEEETSVKIIMANIEDVSVNKTYMFGKKGLKWANRKEEEVNKRYFIREEDWHIVENGNEFSIYVNRKEHIRPLFIIDMPKVKEELFCEDKFEVKEIMTLAEEVLPYSSSYLSNMDYVKELGELDAHSVEKVCSEKSKNKTTFLCKHLDDVLAEKIKVIVLNVGGLNTILRLEFKDSLYLCPDFIKPSELDKKRSIDRIAVHKIKVQK